MLFFLDMISGSINDNSSNMKMSKIKYVGIPIVMLMAFCIWLLTKKTVCRLPAISSVQYGAFIEWIPVTGAFLRDTIPHSHQVRVQIDEIYAAKVTTGLKATTQVEDSTYLLELAHVYPDIDNGRITVDMNFTGAIPPTRADKSLRLRLELSKPADALLLPIGAFYFDTKGKWVFVIDKGVAVKRDIRLGRKNFEYFEVIEGLKPGEQVITSSYENFKSQGRRFF